MGKDPEHPSTDVVFEEGCANKVNTRSKYTISLVILIIGCGFQYVFVFNPFMLKIWNFFYGFHFGRVDFIMLNV